MTPIRRMARGLRKVRAKESVAAMIDSLSAINLPLPKRAGAAEPGEAPAFSYALASAALEAQAGASLKTFGAAGGADVAASPARAAKPTATADAPSPRPAATPESKIVRTETESAPRASAAPTAETPTPQPASPAAPAAAAVAAPTVALAAAPAAQASAPASRVEGAARDALAQRAASETARLKAPARMAPATQDFARLLARRFDDGATAFELRLDPPSLGRVAAKLTVGEDGRAQLALTFDNQAAHDLFRRDEAGLRVLLAAAGFDLGAGDLAFSFAPQGEAPAAAPFHAADFPQALAADARFSAAWSRGLVDLTA